MFYGRNSAIMSKFYPVGIKTEKEGHQTPVIARASVNIFNDEMEI